MTRASRVYESIVDLIANPENPTPMVKISEGVNPNEGFSIYLKLERYNPFGSIKDRIALSMLEGVEVKEGQALVEPSSGNTGIALAALANAKGIPIPIIPERRSKRFGGRNAEKQGRGKIYKSKSI
jgi:cysteine synthase A/cysteine synthase B